MANPNRAKGLSIRTKRLVIIAILPSLLAGFALQSPQSPPLFTDNERAQLLTYWNAPNRYTVSPPPDFRQKGLWQVRLSTDGSTWLWNYNKARKVSAPPTADAQPANDQQRMWEAWLVKQLAHDRWEALQVARQANQSALGIDAPAPDKNTPPIEPEKPGPMPADMLAAVGDPPPLARAVVPMQHVVQFDDAQEIYLDHILMGNPRYAYFRFLDGAQSEGQPVSSVPADRIAHLCGLAGCNDSEAKVMRAVSRLEGGFDSINTYDTGYVSVGFIQFASLREGAGSLGAMLLHYKTDDPADFATDFHRFGVDVSMTGALEVVDPATGAEIAASDANRRIIQDKRLIAVFQRAGQKSDAFCAAQIKSAKAQFYPAEDAVTIPLASGSTLTGKVSDFVKSEAGLATLFDRKVNTGNLAALPKVAGQVADEHQISAIQDLAGYEREIVVALKYRGDFLSDPTLSQPGGARARTHQLASRSGKRRRQKPRNL